MGTTICVYRQQNKSYLKKSDKLEYLKHEVEEDRKKSHLKDKKVAQK